MDEPGKEIENMINAQRERMAGLHSIKTNWFYTIYNLHVQYLSYKKGSTEPSNLCTKKVSYNSVS